MSSKLDRIDLARANRHLAKVDPVMGRLIRAVGPCTLECTVRHSPFEDLVRSVAYQQLNGKAAATILRRFIALFPDSKFPRPEEIETVTDEAIRGAGLSRSKTLAIRDLAAKTIEGVVPNARQIARLQDDEIIERLIQVRGIGRWTVEMLLIFNLGRLDVLPAGDFGVLSGFRIAFRKRDLPKPLDLLKHGERWKPYRTIAAWYLWRAVERSRAKAK